MDLLLTALAGLGHLTGVTTSAAAYALVSATHILGIALLLGPILLIDLALLGRIEGLDGAALALLRRTAMIGFALAVAAGVLLLSARPWDYASHPIVWAKFAAITLATINALAHQKRAVSGNSHGAAALHASASIALWLCALLLGRWIAFY